ncbi:hypothetical protein HOB87_09580 [Candidatus Woesearchaeota archaeon]|jgi:hypothetical protein|nr:hypothetical protein [Candidatus Woesearchaeota archaeon]
MITCLQNRNNILYLPNSSEPFTGVTVGVTNPYSYKALQPLISWINPRIMLKVCRYHYINGYLDKRVCYDLSRKPTLTRSEKIEEDKILASKITKKYSTLNALYQYEELYLGESENNWYSHLQRLTEISFSNGKLNNKYIVWHDNGFKKFECDFINNKVKDGEYYEYNYQGELTITHIYKNNKKHFQLKKIWQKVGLNPGRLTIIYYLAAIIILISIAIIN